MAHVVQVGVGSGGMVVLDLLARDPHITAITLIEPDVFKPHNVSRHLFGPQGVGEFKAELAADWVKARRPELKIETLLVDLTDQASQQQIDQAVAAADLGVCAVDNEPAKYHWDGLMRKNAKRWTLGEVLSGGIGGFVHLFEPGGPCYGCVASFLKREVTVDKPPTPDYSQPGGAVHEVTVPASAASIHAIAGLHAVLTLRLLEPPPPGKNHSEGLGFTSLLLALQEVPGVFEEALRPHRLRIPRHDACLFCHPPAAPPAAEKDLDDALDQALARLGDGA